MTKPMKVICGSCQTEMVPAGHIKTGDVLDVSFRCPVDDCINNLQGGVRLRVDSTPEKPCSMARDVLNHLTELDE